MSYQAGYFDEQFIQLALRKDNLDNFELVHGCLNILLLCLKYFFFTGKMSKVC